MKDKSGNLELRMEDQIKVEYGNHVCFPLYMNSYENALRSIFLRILWIEDSRQKNRNGLTYISQERESNIISFIGARGSGKTTAMMEFSHIINRLNERNEWRWWIERVFTEQPLKESLITKEFFFKVLEPIDASSLEEKEDLFEMVMSAIFREYEKIVEATRYRDGDIYSNREILSLFDEIITGYHAIKNSREENFGDSYIPKLKYMSTSMDINKKMKNLTERLLDIYGKENKDKDRGNYNNCFLVISLDDLDLNIRHGYEMLEQLRKYFFQTNIIITLSGDYDQLNRICKYHYVKEFSEEKSHVIEEGVQEDCRQLALDYILKTLPINARVFMPSLETMTRDVIVGRGETAIGVKAFVMVKIAEAIRNYYDIKGLKIHFSEPRTVRELVNYNQFLASLREIDYEEWDTEKLTEEEQLAWMNHYDQNHERFNQDILGRLVNLLLDDEHRKIFDEWSKQNLERRASGISKIFWEKIRERADQEIEYNVRSYTYGELLEGIYRYGRLSDENRQFVKCVLAYLSSEMVREKISSLKNPAKDSRKHSQIRLKKFLGASFGNDWLGQMVPGMYINFNPLFGHGTYQNFGYYLKAEGNLLEVRFPIPLKRTFYKFGRRNMRQASDIIIKNALKGFKDWLERQQVIPILECLAMFYEPMREQNKLKFNMHIGIDESSVSGEHFVFVRGNNVSCCLDIFGFVKKTFNYEDTYQRNCQDLTDSLTDMVLSYIAEINKEDVHNEVIMMDGSMAGNFRKAMSTIVEELSIHKKCPWDNQEGAAFPFYDLDLSYNLMKRARNELLEENPSFISSRECYTYIVKVYKKIITLLDEQEEVYEGKGVPFGYARNFKNCPFIKVFLDEDDKLPEDFKNRLGAIIFNTMQPGFLQETDHPEEIE